MIALDTTPDVSKPRRRPVAKSSKPQAEKPMKIGLYISAESWRRLGVFSTMENRSQGDIVDELIRQNLKKYVVQVRSTRSEESPHVPEGVSAP